MTAESLRESRERFGLTQEDLAKMLHSSRKTVNLYENGGNIPKPKISLINKLFEDLEKKYILTGEGEMFKDTNIEVGNINNKGGNVVVGNRNNVGNEERFFSNEEVKAVPFDNYMMVEYVDLSTAAGQLSGFGVNVDDLPDYKKKLIPKEFDKGNYLVVQVYGDSMDDGTGISIPDGTDILVKEYILNKGEKLPIRNNLFVIVSTEGTVFKQIVEHNIEEGYIVCHSYNPKYKDYKIFLSDIVQIFVYRKVVSFRPPIPEI